MTVSFTSNLRLKKQDKKEKVIDHLAVFNDNMDIIDTAVNNKASTDDLAEVALSGSYNDLLDKPTVLNGREVEIAVVDGYIKWRYEGDIGWNNLIALSQLEGQDGKSAYELAVENGFDGSMQQWIQSLVGKSAYEIAVELGFEGTKEEWESSLHGDFFYVMYSDEYPTSDSDMYSDPTNHSPNYMGVATTKSPVQPTLYTSYKWSKITGEDGAQGIPGSPGTNQYLHIKYSNDGLTFTDNNGETVGTWIGTLVDNNPDDSMVFSHYTWKRFVGTDGESSYTYVRYSQHPDGQDMISTYIPGVTLFRGILITNSTESADINDHTKYTWSLFEATDGENAVSIALTNSNTSLNADINGNVDDYSNAVTTIEAFDGDAEIDLDDLSITVTTQFVTGSLTGKTYQVSDLNSDVGYVKFEITYKNIVYQRTFTITKNQPGQPGTDGESSYVHIKYSNDGGSTFTDNNGNDVGSYIGVCTNNVESSPSDPDDYTWTRIQGNDGRDSHIYIKYSDDGGLTFTDNEGTTEGAYIGVYVSFDATAPTSPSVYTWSKIQGNDGANGSDGAPGEDAYTITITSSCTALPCDYFGVPIDADDDHILSSPITNDINVYQGGQLIEYWNGEGVQPSNSFTLMNSSFLQEDFDETLSDYGIPDIIDNNTGVSLSVDKISVNPLDKSITIPITVTILDQKMNQRHYSVNWNVIKTLSADEESLEKILTEGEMYQGTFEVVDDQGVKRLGINADAIKTGILSAERINFNGAQMKDASGNTIMSMTENGIYINGKFHILKVFDETNENVDVSEEVQPFLIQRKTRKYDDNGITIIETEPESLVYFSTSNTDDKFFINNAVMPSVTVSQRIKFGSMFDLVLNEDLENKTSHLVLL